MRIRLSSLKKEREEELAALQSEIDLPLNEILKCYAAHEGTSLFTSFWEVLSIYSENLVSSLYYVVIIHTNEELLARYKKVQREEFPVPSLVFLLGVDSFLMLLFSFRIVTVKV